MTNERILKLEKELRKLEAESVVSEALVDTLVNLGYAYSFIDPDKSEQYGEQARELAESIQYQIGECRSYNLTGLVLMQKGDYPEAYEWFRRLLCLAREIDFKMGESSALGNCGQIYSALGEYDEALKRFTEAIGIDKEIENRDGIVANLLNIGDIYSQLKDYKKALKYYNIALDEVDKDSNSLYVSSYIIATFNHIASTCLSLDSTEGVMDSIRRSIEIGTKVNDTAGLASSHVILGEYYEKLNDYSKSLQSFSKAHELFEILGFRMENAESSLNVGRISTKMGDLKEALNYLHKGMEIAQEIGSRAIEAKGYRYLSEFYEAQDNYEEAFRHYKTYRELYDEIAGKDKAESIARIELAQDIAKKEREAEIHRLKNVELVREIEERRKVERALKESEDKYRKLSIEDPLTGVFNRRYLFERGAKIIDRSLSGESDFCLGLLDIDSFKSINDEFSHQAGDYVLREFAKIVSECIRPNDFLARYGGEEFVILLLDCGLSKASAVMNRINQTVESYKFGFNDIDMQITVSGGISHSGEIDSPEILEGLIKLADKRLYAAKDSGRNRIIHQDF